MSWQWGAREQKAFDAIKDLVTNAPCLALVDLTDEALTLEVHTDASNVALGGVLLAWINGK